MLSKISINVPALARLFGGLLVIESAFMLIPLVASLLYGEMGVAKAFGLTVAITACLGGLMAYYIRPKNSALTMKDGFFLTASTWLIFSLFGMLPFIISGVLPSFADAFYESISGFTTTGSTVVKDVESLPRGILLWRAVMQWIGGMGIILFTLAVTPMLSRKNGVQLFNAEVTGITNTKIRPRIGQSAKTLWMVYLVFTIISFVLMWIGPMEFFDALCHTLSGVSTGGFSTKNNSIAYWDSEYLHLMMLGIMFVGGVNFTLIYKLLRGDFAFVKANECFRAYLDLALVSATVIGIYVYLNEHVAGLYEAIKCGFFMTFSAMTSSGYSISSFEEAGPIATLMVFFVMIFGAMAGSTSGGAKVDRLVMLVKIMKNEIYLILHPFMVRTPRFNGNPLDKSSVNKLLSFMTLYFLVLAFSILFLVCYGLPLFDAMFTALQALSNIGMGYGVTGVNFASLPDICKIFLGIIMIVGRLEIFTVFMIFTKSFWQR